MLTRYLLVIFDVLLVHLEVSIGHDNFQTNNSNNSVILLSFKQAFILNIFMRVIHHLYINIQFTYNHNHIAC